MARTRQVKPNYPHEAEIRALSLAARYFYLLSWCHMTDPNPKENIIGGVLPHDSFYLQTNIFPGENIDVEPIITEIIGQKRYFPFEAQGKKWLWCPTMPKHQNISHPAKEFKYPDPPVELIKQYQNRSLNESSMSPHGGLPQSRVERIEGVDIKDQPSEKLKAALDKVIKDGFNIYKLLGRLKKEMRWQKDQLFPDEVLLGVCESYEKGKGKIKDQWAWFKVAIRQESEQYFATKNIEEHRKLKAQGPMSLAQIMASIGSK
jgi:hypothetical protein